MKVLGIDCGLATTGWAIVEQDKNVKSGKYKVYSYGVITTPAGEEMSFRLKNIYDELSALIKEFKPEEVAIENLYFFKNQKTIITVGQARGVAILSAVNSGLRVFDYTPLQVKISVCGYGRAEKVQVQKMVKSLLSLKSIPEPDDAADALAVAVCHLSCVS
ncbi:crossover junction endodeoxyribonuclease RuvC [Candidatus Dojkabacteria bacterium]|nr:crossover junction endodeoxyribonuclease RuvC [Candidatus Dojkabacteria bacterium]